MFPSQVLEPAAALKKAGRELHLAAFTSPAERLRHPPALAAREDAARRVFETVALPVYPSLFHGWSLSVLQLRRILQRTTPDCIHARNPLATCLALRARSRRSHPPVLFDCRGAWAEEFRLSGGYRSPPLVGNRLNALVERCATIEAEAARHATQILAVTRPLAAHLASYGRDTRAATILPCCVQAQRFRFSPEARHEVRTALGIGDSPLWIYSGSAAVWQEPEKTVRLFCGIQAAHPTHQFLILSREPEPFRRWVARAGGRSEGFHFHHCKAGKVGRFLSAADAAVLLRRPSIVNAVASPVKFSEYACAGIPVLVSRAAEATARLVEKYGWGVVLTAGDDPARGADDLQKTLPLTPQERARRGAQAAALFDWNRGLRVLEGAYRSARQPKERVLFHINHTYPVTTQTFTVREVHGLRAKGLDLRTVSLRHPAPPCSVQTVPEEERRTWYLPPLGSPQCLLANARQAGRSPRLFIRWLWRCLTAPYPAEDGLRQRAQSLAQFLRAALLADTIGRTGLPGHLHAQFADGAATSAMLAAAYLDMPFSFASHTSYNSQLLAEKLARASGVVSISRFDEGRLKRMRSSAPIEVVRCGIPTGEWPFRAGRGAAGQILSVGSLVEKKGHHILLQACRRLRDRGVPFHCGIVGAGPLRRELLRQVERFGLGGAVQLMGPQPSDRVRALLGRARVFVLACVEARNTDIDGIPVALMEAMATGVPVIATAVSGIPELIEDGRNGRLVPPADPDALAEALAGALTDPLPCAAHVQAARAAIEEEYSLDRQVEQLLHFLDRLCDVRPVRCCPTGQPT